MLQSQEVLLEIFQLAVRLALLVGEDRDAVLGLETVGERGVID